jgi:hypothetical protein
MHRISFEGKITHKINVSVALFLKVIHVFWKWCDTVSKKCFVWKRTPLNGRKCFTHQKKIAHPQRFHPSKLHIAREYRACLSYKHFLSNGL